MSCGVGQRHGSDLALLWLCRVAALLWPITWELPYAMGSAALKRQNKQTKNKYTNKSIYPTQAFYIMSCNFIQVFEWEPMRRNQPSLVNQKPPVQRELVQEQKSGPDLSRPSFGFWRKGPAPCCYRDLWKVTRDKHWRFSAIWLSSLQRFLNWGQLTELRKPRKCSVNINSLTGRLYSSNRTEPPSPSPSGGGRGWGGRDCESKTPIFFLPSEMNFFYLLCELLLEFLGRMSDGRGTGELQGSSRGRKPPRSHSGPPEILYRKQKGRSHSLRVFFFFFFQLYWGITDTLQPPVTTFLLFASMSLTILDFIFMWNHAVFAFQCLAYFIYHNVLQVHLCCCKEQDFSLYFFKAAKYSYVCT